jgi:acyl-CoA synthetase (AMP-forming)/AMP-acid ligase II
MSADRLADAIRRHAIAQPDRPALIFLADGDREKARWTYGELDRHARRIASCLVASGTVGRPVLLIFPSGLDFVAAFCGCLYAGAIAVPVPLPAGGAASLRLRAIVAAAQPAAILTARGTPGSRDAGELAASGLDGVRILFIDDATAAEDEAEGPLGGTDIALIQYTSGSTSRPKGVIIREASLCANLEMLRRAWRVDRDSRFVSWLPLFHDMGLISVVLESLWAGAMAVLMSPLAFLHDPADWLSAIGRYRATIGGGPNFAFDLCVRRRRAAPAFDLASWQVAFCASEPVRATTMEAFAAAFAPQGFRAEALYPAYGLAEATAFVSGGLVEAGVRTVEVPPEAPSEPTAFPRRLVGCGAPWGDESVVIVDPTTREPLPNGRIGEIWVGGSHVAAGYWNDPVPTRETFQATLAGSSAPYFLRTGDLGLLRDGELYVAGRLKDLLVIRGVGIDPSDVEATIARSHPALGDIGAAFTVDAHDGEQVVAVHQVGREAPTGPSLQEAVVAAFKAVCDEHGVRLFDLVLVRSGGVPRTTSGKVQRHRCREQYLAGAITKVSAGADYRWLGKYRRDAGTAIPPLRTLPSASRKVLAT